MKVLVMGASGMAGHVIAKHFVECGSNVYGLTNIPFNAPNSIVCDVLNSKLLEKTIKGGKFDVIINAIGILNESADKNKNIAVYLNSYLPHFVASLISNTKTKLIHMSTDCVFSGEIGNYKESDFADGATFYDKSKALGEVVDDKNLTFRNSIIGPDVNKCGIGLFNWFMAQSSTINGFTKAIWSGVSTITLAKAMQKAIDKNLTGLYHLTNNNTINKLELLKLFSKHLKGDKITVNKVDGWDVNKSLICTRNDFDFVVPSYEEMVIEIKEWVVRHKELYPHYEVVS